MHLKSPNWMKIDCGQILHGLSRKRIVQPCRAGIGETVVQHWAK
jgi:hypothetical protein